MKYLKNLPIAFIATTILVVVLAAVGWIVSFAFEFKLDGTNGDPISEWDLFLVRMAIGTAFLGLFAGIGKIYDCFMFFIKGGHQ